MCVCAPPACGAFSCLQFFFFLRCGKMVTNCVAHAVFDLTLLVVDCKSVPSNLFHIPAKCTFFFFKKFLFQEGKCNGNRRINKRERNNEVILHFIQGQHTLYVDKLFCSKSILMHTECTPSQRAAVNCVAKCPFSFHPNGFDSSRAPINTGGGLQVLSAL